MKRVGPRLLAAAAALVLLAGCRVDVVVAVDIGAGGAGAVAVTISLDPAAATQVPDLASLLDLDDLRAAGWRVEGPTVLATGGARLRAEKRVGGLAEANTALAELSGPAGPFGSLRLARERTLSGTATTLSGRIDLVAGLAGFSDPKLQERLGGLPIGVDPVVLERELGLPLAEVFQFTLDADLPGRSATVGARLGESVPVAISGHRVDARRVALAAVSVTAGLGLVLVLWRRRWP